MSLYIKHSLLLLLSSLLLCSCSFWQFDDFDTERSYLFYAMNLGQNQPYSEAVDKLGPPDFTGGDVSKGDFAAVWRYESTKHYFEPFTPLQDDIKYQLVDPRIYTSSTTYYSYTGVFRKGKLVDWYGNGNMIPLRKKWRDAHLPLLRFLIAHKEQSLATIKEYYEKYPWLDTQENHLLGALVATKNGNAELLSYYIKERKVPVNKKLNSWQLTSYHDLNIYRCEYRNDSILETMRKARRRSDKIDNLMKELNLN